MDSEFQAPEPGSRLLVPKKPIRYSCTKPANARNTAALNATPMACFPGRYPRSMANKDVLVTLLLCGMRRSRSSVGVALRNAGAVARRVGAFCVRKRGYRLTGPWRGGQGVKISDGGRQARVWLWLCCRCRRPAPGTPAHLPRTAHSLWRGARRLTKAQPTRARSASTSPIPPHTTQACFRSWGVNQVAMCFGDVALESGVSEWALRVTDVSACACIGVAAADKDLAGWRTANYHTLAKEPGLWLMYCCEGSLLGGGVAHKAAAGTVRRGKDIGQLGWCSSPHRSLCDANARRAFARSIRPVKICPPPQAWLLHRSTA